MRFCDKCGSYMKMTTGVYLCHKCGRTEQIDELEIIRMKDKTPNSIYTVHDSDRNFLRVNRICPRCDNHEAFRSVFTTSGEHAGVKQERTVEHYKCTKCFHNWTRS